MGAFFSSSIFYEKQIVWQKSIEQFKYRGLYWFFMGYLKVHYNFGEHNLWYKCCSESFFPSKRWYWKLLILFWSHFIADCRCLNSMIKFLCDQIHNLKLILNCILLNGEFNLRETIIQVSPLQVKYSISRALNFYSW